MRIEIHRDGVVLFVPCWSPATIRDDPALQVFADVELRHLAVVLGHPPSAAAAAALGRRRQLLDLLGDAAAAADRRCRRRRRRRRRVGG